MTQPVRAGSRGDAVADIRVMLAGLGLLRNIDPAARDVFDPACELAVRAFQQRRGLTVDGVVGPETYRALIGARWKLGDRVLGLYVAAPLGGDDVATLQTQLLELGYDLGRPDGVFALRTEQALRAFQRDSGLAADGLCGPATMRALGQLGRRVVGGRPQLLRDLVAVADAGPSLLGKRVVLDPSHGGHDRGTVVGALAEADLVWDLAARLEGRLTAVGVTTWLTRGPNNSSSDERRAQFANDQRADLLLSLHLDSAPSPKPHGVATYYYGAGETSSTLGERLADLVQREIVARTLMLDARTHGKTWELLRLTRMTAVWVELGYLSSPLDRAQLVDPLFRDVVAEAMLVAIQRLYLPKESDPPTGVMRFPDTRAG